jgi:hypothetical protein
MHENIGRSLSAFKLGEVQTHANMAVVPILWPKSGGPDYLTMKEALEKSVLVVTEVSEGGSVPNLKVANKGNASILLLDGEEVAGAKQNRVLNTTILVGGKSEVVIPVSCTEQGRWNYASAEFFESGNIMSPNIRMAKNRSVSVSYAAENLARSDQSAVWNGIHEMSRDAGAPSQTGAMRDVFEKRAGELDDYIKAFTCLHGQKGLIVFIGSGEKIGAPVAVGFDCLSRDKAFAVLFPKLVKSYAMEAWLASRKKGAVKGAEADKKGKTTKKGIKDENAGVNAAAKAFLAEAIACEEKIYDSVGLGKDYRYTGAHLVGSALAVDDAVIHTAFFRVTESEQAGKMAAMNRRRSFRI